ncbi:hypothetical protein BgiMline_012849 [Biomphalaria glabrata]
MEAIQNAVEKLYCREDRKEVGLLNVPTRHRKICRYTSRTTGKTVECVGRLHSRHQVRMTFQYVPPHIVIKRADELAKLGTLQDPTEKPEIKVAQKAINVETKTWKCGRTSNAQIDQMSVVAARLE